MNPPGPYSKKYQILIVNNCTWYTKGPCFCSKDKITNYIIRFCKRQKLIRGQYPTIQQIDSSTKFNKFKIQVEGEGMIFKLIAAYIPEANSIIEYIEGYIN